MAEQYYADHTCETCPVCEGKGKVYFHHKDGHYIRCSKREYEEAVKPKTATSKSVNTAMDSATYDYYQRHRLPPNKASHHRCARHL